VATPESAELDRERVPAPVRELVRTLADAGHPTLLVGGCVRDLLRGEPVRDFDAATRASAEAVLELFPRAVPIGVRHGTVMIPTASGPVDVTALRAGSRIEDDLAHRDFTVNAIAFDPLGGELLDPFEGRADLARGRLRAVRSARERFREDPLRALRAARFAATLGLAPDPEVVSAMAECAGELGRVAVERIRAELDALLRGSQAGEGLALLRRTGIEAALAPGVSPGAARLVDALPPRLELRLAAWLRGARALSILRRLRFSRGRAERVERLLRLHPVDALADPAREGSVRRLLKKAGGDWDDLRLLRRAELRLEGAGPAAEACMAALEAAVARAERSGRLALHRLDLALDGKAVMAALGCGPGPAVGEALAHLTERVLDDPACNTREDLERLLREWWARRGRASRGAS